MSDQGETWWGQSEPLSNMAVGGPEGNEIMLGIDIPDWVRLPAELGGNQVRVTGHHIGPCPKDTSHNARHLHLDGDIQVAECYEHKFMWYAVREKGLDTNDPT